MTTVATRPRTPATTVSRTRPPRVPLWAAVVCSRLIVLGAAALGALTLTRAYGWQPLDPTRVTTSLGSVGNVLAASTDRWDAVHYLAIAQHGYTNAEATVFYPLYPMLIHALAWIVRSDVVAGIVISMTSFCAALVLLHRLATEELGVKAADATVLLLAFAPLSFFFTAIYTESLFLLLSVSAFYLARRDRFLFAALVAAAATATHIEGVLLVAPMAHMYFAPRRQGRRWTVRRGISPTALALLLPVGALAAFFIYLHARGYGWLAPISNETTGYGRSFGGPAVTVVDAFSAALGGLGQTLAGVPPIEPSTLSPFNMGFQNLVYFGVLILTVTTLIGAWRRLPAPYAIYATLMLVMAIWSPAVGRPLGSFDRYTLVMFPLWMAAAKWVSDRNVIRSVVGLGTAGLLFYSMAFACWVFVA